MKFIFFFYEKQNYIVIRTIIRNSFVNIMDNSNSFLQLMHRLHQFYRFAVDMR